MFSLIVLLAVPSFAAEPPGPPPMSPAPSGPSAKKRAPFGPAAKTPYAVLERIVSFGNRHAGAPRRKEAIAMLERELAARGLETGRDAFEGRDPRDGRMWPMVNIWGRWRPGAACRLLLGSHYDARHEAEMDPVRADRGRPIEGANDSGSGVAVLIHLASRFGRILPKGVGADVVFFDGEEMGYQDAGGYCLGSQRFAANLPLSPRPRFGIVLDMVGSPKAVFKVESYSQQSHPGIVDALWTIGERREPGAFSRERWGWIRDDHVPLAGAGIPSILLIGYNDPNWHTGKDTLKGVSPRRLDLAASVLEEFLAKKASSFLGDCK